MWQPDPAWQRLPGSMGAGGGLFLTPDGHVVKRLAAPAPEDPPYLHEPTSPAYWRREAEVALDGTVTRTPGLRAVSAVAVEEDAEGATITLPEVEGETPNGLYVARALGRFATYRMDAGWLARRQLRFRLARTEERGGWTRLTRTSAAPVVTSLWQRRERHLAMLDALPPVLQHGDPVPTNLRGRAGEEVRAIDWANLGTGPVGGDLGYWWLSAREDLEHLIDAYVDGLGPQAEASRLDVLTGARITAAYTVLTRADWALSRVSSADEPLSGALRHPAVAPHLRALQRAGEVVEPLLA